LKRFKEEGANSKGDTTKFQYEGETSVESIKKEANHFDKEDKFAESAASGKGHSTISKTGEVKYPKQRNYIIAMLRSFKGRCQRMSLELEGNGETKCTKVSGWRD